MEPQQHVRKIDCVQQSPVTLHVRRTPSPSFTACDFGSFSKCGVRLRVGSSSGSDGIAGVGRFFPAEPDCRAAAVAGDRFISIGTAISSSSISLIVSSLVLLPLVEDLIGKSSKVGRMSSVSSAEISIVMSEVTSVMNDVLSDSRSDSSVASAFTTPESACFVDPVWSSSSGPFMPLVNSSFVGAETLTVTVVVITALSLDTLTVYSPESSKRASLMLSTHCSCLASQLWLIRGSRREPLIGLSPFIHLTSGGGLPGVRKHLVSSYDNLCQTFSPKLKQMNTL